MFLFGLVFLCTLLFFFMIITVSIRKLATEAGVSLFTKASQVSKKEQRGSSENNTVLGLVSSTTHYWTNEILNEWFGRFFGEREWTNLVLQANVLRTMARRTDRAVYGGPYKVSRLHCWLAAHAAVFLYEEREGMNGHCQSDNCVVFSPWTRRNKMTTTKSCHRILHQQLSQNTDSKSSSCSASCGQFRHTGCG